MSFSNFSPPNVPKPCPIKEINTFIPRWSICGQVVKVEPVRNTVKNKVFSVVIADEHGDNINGTFWADAADKFQSRLREGGIYSFSKGRVTVSNKRYTTTSHYYALTFTSDSEIIEITDPAAKEVQCSLTFNAEGGLRSLKTAMKERIDVLGVILSARLTGAINVKKGGTMAKREFTVCDNTGHKIQVDFWANSEAELSGNFEESHLNDQPLVAIRNCRISNYRGKTLAGDISEVFVVPQSDVEKSKIPQLKEQLAWYEENKSSLHTLVPLTEEYQAGGGGGGSAKANTISMPEYTSLSAANQMMRSVFMDQGLESHEVTWRTIANVGRYWPFQRDSKELNCVYKACSQCGTKWSSEVGCAKCGGETTAEHRWMLNASFADFSGSRLSARLFAGHGESALGGMKAEEVFQKQQSGSEVTSTFNGGNLHKPMVIRFKGSLKSYMGEQRFNLATTYVERLEGSSFVTEALRMAKHLEGTFPELLAGENKRARVETPVEADAKRQMV